VVYSLRYTLEGGYPWWYTLEGGYPWWYTLGGYPVYASLVYARYVHHPVYTPLYTPWVHPVLPLSCRSTLHR